ncbi:MAG: PD-(D/E)XK nuclease family protein [Acidimicrobiales bacterium]
MSALTRAICYAPAMTHRSSTITVMAGRIERVVPGVCSEDVLAAEIRTIQADDRLAPVFVAVRSPIVGLRLRRRLAEERAYAAVRIASLQVLVEQLGTWVAAAGGRRPLSQVALRAAARAALGEIPGPFAPVASHPTTEASLAATYSDLRWASETELRRLRASSERAGGVVALTLRMRQLLEPGFYDEVRLLEAASAWLGDPEAAEDLDEIGSVVAYLPDPLRPLEIDLLGHLARRLDVVALVARTRDELADRSSVRFLRQLQGCFGDSEPGSSDPSLGGTDATTSGAGDTFARGTFDGLLSAPDTDVEVREAVRRLVSHAQAGGDLGRCIVTYPDGTRSASYGLRVTEQLRAAGIPHSGGPSRPLGDTPHGRLLLGLVALSTPAPAGFELDRRQVFAWLSSGPVRCGHGLTRALASVEALGALPVAAWDRCSRLAGVVSGIEQWRGRLRSYMARMTEAQTDAASESLFVSGDLLELVERLHYLTFAARAARTWRELCIWAGEALEEILEPDDDRRVLTEALADLEQLDSVDPLDGLGPVERLRRFFLAVGVALERPIGDHGRYGAGPVIGPLSSVAGASCDVLLIVGCREGELPSRRAEDPLISSADRLEIAALAGRESAEELARRHLAWAVSAAAMTRASFARIDVEAGRTAYPSRWNADLCSGEELEVPSFTASIKRVAEGATPASDQTDLELAWLQADDRRHGSSWLEIVDADYRRRLSSLSERLAGGLNPFAGYVPAAGLAAPGGPVPPAKADGPPDRTGEVRDEMLSASGLESFAACPFRFFVDRRLGVSELEAPERLITIDPRERGTLMHRVVEGFFVLMAEQGSLVPFDDRSRERLEKLAMIQFDRLEQLGRTGKALFWAGERGRILADLERYVENDVSDCITAGRVPLRLELDFGQEGRPVVEQIAGRSVSFRGRIDRVDLTESGRLVVVDYKSGSKEGYSDISREPLGRGSHLQLPLYAKAAREVFSAEVTGRELVRAEYRFMQSSADYAVIKVELDEELESALLAVLTTLVSTIEAGCFPPRPGAAERGSTYRNCRYCDFDPLCTTDRADLWERASTDNQMANYAELVTGQSR